MEAVVQGLFYGPLSCRATRIPQGSAAERESEGDNNLEAKDAWIDVPAVICRKGAQVEIRDISESGEARETIMNMNEP